MRVENTIVATPVLNWSLLAIYEAYEILNDDESVPEDEHVVEEYDRQLDILRHKFEKIRRFKRLVGLT